VIANYYMKYMAGFDAQLMRNVVMVSGNLDSRGFVMVKQGGEIV